MKVRVSCLIRNLFRRSGRYISLVSEFVHTHHHDDDDGDGDDFSSSYGYPADKLHISWYRSFQRDSNF